MSLNLDIESVSDTAFATAHARAIESRRRDRLFVDPYASQLASRRGREAMDQMPGKQYTVAGCVVRTCLIDRQVKELFEQHHIDCVVNLGAGLDTRPYRLSLPSACVWVEVDFEEVLTYKSAILKPYHPKCSLVRVVSDVMRPRFFGDVIDSLNKRPESTLVICEGLLTYLKNEQVASIASQITQEGTAKFWVTDLVSDALMQLMRKLLNAPTSTQVALRFAPTDGAGFFGQFGWKPIFRHSCFDEGRTLKRWLVDEDFVSRLNARQLDVIRTLLDVVCLVRSNPKPNNSYD